MSTFVLNVPFEPKFWQRYCSIKLERNSCMKFFQMFHLRTKILAPPLYTVYTVYLSVVTCAPQIFIRGGPHDIICIVYQFSIIYFVYSY